MKKIFQSILFTVVAIFTSVMATAQCSICTKTASQLGEEAGKGLNGGIIYLAAAPMLIVGYIGYRWWKNNS